MKQIILPGIVHLNIRLPLALLQPEPSSPESIELKGDERLVIIEVDLLEYKKRTNMKSVKKTLTIPEWLNREALAKGINFSQVLQEALISKLKSL